MNGGYATSIARNLVEAGNRRAAAEGLTNCRFQDGDATNLHDLTNRSFDLLVSILGAMFVPKPFDGPTMNAFDAAEKNGRAADLQSELEALVSAQNQSGSETATSIPATFLRVTVAV